MDKESKYELQKIDCNCNDCKHMVRDVDKYNYSKTLHELRQRQYFDLINRKKLEKAEDWLTKTNHDWEKALLLIQEINTFKFQFNNDAHISYGDCMKRMESISFVANTCQLETQKCFEHRK